MRVLLQDRETKRFYAGPNQWTEDAAQAHDFEKVDGAMQVYDQEHVAFAEIIVQDITMGLSAPRPERMAAEAAMGQS